MFGILHATRIPCQTVPRRPICAPFSSSVPLGFDHQMEFLEIDAGVA